MGRPLCVAGVMSSVYDGYFSKYICMLYIFINMYYVLFHVPGASTATVRLYEYFTLPFCQRGHVNPRAGGKCKYLVTCFDILAPCTDEAVFCLRASFLNRLKQYFFCLCLLIIRQLKNEVGSKNKRSDHIFKK
jgi:hypothetical protein